MPARASRDGASKRGRGGAAAGVVEQAAQPGAGALRAVGGAQQARVLVHHQHQAVDLEHHLLRVGAAREVAFLHRLADRLQQFGLPAGDDRNHLVALRPGAVVVLDGAGDHDAAERDLAREERDPAVEDRFQPGQAARLLHGGAQHVVDEALHVLLQHGQLQVLARAEVREHPALAHLHLVGERADRQPFEPVARGDPHRRLDDRRTRHLALARPERGGEVRQGRGDRRHRGEKTRR